jgi:hypothetical protein
MKRHREISAVEELRKFELKFHGLSTFRNEVVYIDLLKDENYKHLISMQSNLLIFSLFKKKRRYIWFNLNRKLCQNAE